MSIETKKNEGNVVIEEILYHENSILHLQRSNLEMIEFDKNDKDFQVAIEENLKIIEKKKKRIKELKELLPKDDLKHVELEDNSGIEL